MGHECCKGLIYLIQKKMIWQHKGFPSHILACEAATAVSTTTKWVNLLSHGVIPGKHILLLYLQMEPIFSMVRWDFARLPREIKGQLVTWWLFWISPAIPLIERFFFFFYIYDWWLICWLDLTLSEDLRSIFFRLEKDAPTAVIVSSATIEKKKAKKEGGTWRSDRLEGTWVTHSTHD